MAECIEREKVLKLINNRKRDAFIPQMTDYISRWNEAFEQIESDIEDIPAADVVPVVHGKWVANFNDFTPANRCSKCKVNFPDIAGSKTVYSPNLMHYCPNCGAKMDGNTEQTQATD